MNNSSTTKLATDDHQPLAYSAEAEQEDQTVYRYVKMATNTEIPIESVHLESPDINLGDVVEIKMANGKRDYFSVNHMVEGVEEVEGGEEQITTVYLIRARNSLWKSLLLLAILGVGWYVIDLLLNRLF
jgi:hypothetical protein